MEAYFTIKLSVEKIELFKLTFTKICKIRAQHTYIKRRITFIDTKLQIILVFFYFNMSIDQMKIFLAEFVSLE